MGMFQTTRWSLVLKAADAAPASRDALAELCRAYRAPVLAFVRHAGAPRADAEDLTQAFFVKFLARGYCAAADPARGRFRTFLLTALQRHLAKSRAHDRASKRGGGVRHEALDETTAAELDASPEREFERAWAHTVIARALERLEAESVRNGKAALFGRLRPFLVEAPDANDYAALTAELGIRRNTIAVAVRRLRLRLRELIRAELSETVASPADLAEELHALRESLGGTTASSPRAIG